MILRLHTFGSAYLTRDGELLSGAAGQRRLLAILAVLAAVGERGISRDKLLALLWSDGDPDRSRHALTQSLYHIRKALGSERIFLSGNDLRLNPDVITADVSEFKRAVDAERLETAAELYTGAFLDGFYLNGESEFDFWLTEERDRLARQHAATLAALAQLAHERADVSAEIHWRTKLSDQDPLNSAHVAALLRCLIAAGNTAAALLRARSYESRMRTELDLQPDRLVAEIVASIRREPPRAVEAPMAAEASPRTAGTPQPFSRTRRRRRWQIGVAAAIVAVTVGARAAASHIADDRAAVRRETIAVSPFRVPASSATAGYLRDALLELLPTRIGDADRKRTADPAHVLQVWRSVSAAPESLSSASAASRVARDLNAGEIVIGTIGDDPHGVVVHASVVDAMTSRVTASATVIGTADSLIAITDQLITALLMPQDTDRGLAPTSIRATSPSALRAYLAGRGAYRRADYDQAMTAYARALAEDPKFALAALGLAMAADRVNAAEQHDHGVAIAWALQNDLAPSDRAFLRAFAGPRYPGPSSAAEVLSAWEDAVHLAPDRAESWFQLGESFYYDGDLLGMRNALPRAEDAFRRALSLDPSFSPARRMLTLLLARRNDTTALRRLVNASPRDTSDALATFVRWRVAQALGDGRALSRVRRDFADAPNGALRAIAMTSQFDGVSTRDGDRAIEILSHRALTEAELTDLVLARHSRALNSQDYRAALAIAGELGPIEPALHPHLRLRVLDALYSKADSSVARNSAAELERMVRASTPRTSPDSAVRMADLCVLGQWQIAHGDTAGARATIAPLHDGAVSRYPVPVGANPLTCAELLETSIALAEHGRAAAERLAHLDSLMMSGPAVGDAMRYANLVVAREYQRLGDPRRGLAALQRRSFMRGWPRYRATGLQLQIDLALAAGDTAMARAARQRLDATR